jgi:tripartite-type tricarboxylate transporter receptor subunit TctC
MRAEVAIRRGVSAGYCVVVAAFSIGLVAVGSVAAGVEKRAVPSSPAAAATAVVDSNAGELAVTLSASGVAASSPTVVAGAVKITLVNRSKSPRVFTLGGKRSPSVKAGKSVVWRLQLKSGAYKLAGGGRAINIAVTAQLQPLPDGFPDGPITLWATFPVGHPDDLLNREVAAVAAKYSPQKLVTQNDNPGPSLAYGFTTNTLPTLPRAAEGYQIYTSNFAALSIRPYLVAAAKQYDISQLHFIVGVQSSPFAYSVPKNSQFKTLADVVKWAKANPGRLRFVSGGAGSRGFLQMAAWGAEAAVKTVFLPTSDDTQTLTTILGGGAELMGTGLHTVDLAQFRVLAVSGNHRFSILPGTPTMKELGYHNILETSDGYAFSGYGSLPNVPASHQQWIADLLKKVVADAEFKKEYSYAVNQVIAPEQIAVIEKQNIDALFPIVKSLNLNVKER